MGAAMAIIAWAAVSSQPLVYYGAFSGTAELRQFPLPGYYYDVDSYLSARAVSQTIPVLVKVADGGSVCPHLTRYKLYLYSPEALPGIYLTPQAASWLSRFKPMPPGFLGAGSLSALEQSK